MNRTTLSLDPPLLKKLKSISHEEDITLRQLVEELLLRGLEARRKSAHKTAWAWKTHPMGAKIDLTDKDTLYTMLDKDELAR